MILRLRRKHRLMVCTLAVALPVAFVAGIAAKRPVPMSMSLPSALTGRMADAASVVWAKPDLWPGHRIITTLRQEAEGTLAIELTVRDLLKPDVLVYWVAGQEMTDAGAGLPDNARLLGALSSRSPLLVPSEVRDESGRIVLYSLAAHEIVATSTLFTIQND